MISPGRRIRLAVAALGAALTLGAASSPVLAAPHPLSVELSVGSSCIDGYAKPNAFVRALITSPAHTQIGRGVATADPSGAWSFCANDSIQPGAKVDLLVFKTGQRRRFTVPALTISTERVNEVVSGIGPAGSTLNLEVYNPDSILGPGYDATEDVTADPSGAYSFDFSTESVDLVGGAEATVSWAAQNGMVKVFRAAYVPYVEVQLGSSTFGGFTKPDRNAGIKLKVQGAPVATGDAVGDSGFFGYPGQFQGTFLDPNDLPYAVAGGEMLTAPAIASDVSFRIPKINGQANLASDTVTGKCFANGTYVVVAQSSDFTSFGLASGVADGTGNFSAWLGDQVNITKGYDVLIYCLTPNLDIVLQEFTAH